MRSIDPVAATVSLLVLALTFLPCRGAAQSPSPLEIERTATGVQLSWPASVGDWYLKCSEDLTKWKFVTDAPALATGTLTLDLSATNPERFFRLHTPSILFVDGSQVTNGDGSSASPFNSLASAVSEAKTRFSISGDEQTIYVFGGSYSESVVIDGTGLPDFRLNLLDGQTSIGSNGTLIEGDPGEVAQLTSAQGSVLSIIDVACLQISGFDLTGPPAPATGAGEAGGDAPVVIAVSNSKVILEGVISQGGQAGDGSDAVGSGEGFAGGDGGAGLSAVMDSTVEIIDSTISGGNAGNGGDGIGGDAGGDGGRGGNGVFASGESTIRVEHSILAGGDGGLAGTPTNIFFALNGGGGSGIFAEGESFLAISGDSEITGGNGVRADINRIHAAVQASGSTVEIENSTIHGGVTGDAVNVADGMLSVSASTADAGPDGGVGIFADSTNATIIDSTVIGGVGPVLGNTAFPAGFGLQASGPSEVTVERSTLRGGPGADQPTPGVAAGTGGNAFDFIVNAVGGSAMIVDSFLFGGNSGAGGGGFNASGGRGAFVVDAQVEFSNTDIVGGTGSDATPGSGNQGGYGGDGIELQGGTVILDADSEVTAGSAGRGASGEDGGHGGEAILLVSQPGTATITGTTLSGGAGGDGGTGGDGGDGGHAVLVGFAFSHSFPGTATVNAATLLGGRGGDGSGNGDGGEGGSGARVFENGTINLNNSTVTGADGGNGSGTGIGGAGGLAADDSPESASFDPGTLTVSGSTLVNGGDGNP